MASSIKQSFEMPMGPTIPNKSEIDEDIPRNPLICGLCHDYYKDPRLLICFHTFCFNCISDGTQIKICCPICGQLTEFSDDVKEPPKDVLMKTLVEFANAENPQCANCDKRDKNEMFFCATCGQALCTYCRDKTHQAKMFSRHQILVMDKRLKDNQKRCLAHREVYIMFNQSDQVMLCATCFREMSPDTRLHCIDINSAWQRISEKMKRAINSMCEIQTEMHKEIQDLKSRQDNLQCNMNVTKLKLDTYVKDLKKAVDKTHDAVMNGLLHEFHDKQGSMQSRVASLTSILPILKMHLGLCISFMSTADKYQFLELAHTVLERLNRVGQLGHFPQIPIILTSQNDKFKIEFMNALYPFISHFDSDTDMETHFHQYEKKQNQKQSKIHTLRIKQMECDAYPTSKVIPEPGRFNNHCKNFDIQLQKVNELLRLIKERVCELNRDIAVKYQLNISILEKHYDTILRDCQTLDQQLDNQQIELERLRSIFNALWEEQLCRIHLEKEVFHSQINDISSLKNEVKQLQVAVSHIEPFIKTFTPTMDMSKSNTFTDNESNLHLQILLDHLINLQFQNSSFIPKSSKDKDDTNAVQAILDSGGNIVVYGGKNEPKKNIYNDKRLVENKNHIKIEDLPTDFTQISHKNFDAAKISNVTTSETTFFYDDSKKNIPHFLCENQNRQKKNQDIRRENSEFRKNSDLYKMRELNNKISLSMSSTIKKDVTSKLKSMNLDIIPTSDSEDIFYDSHKMLMIKPDINRRLSCDSISTNASESDFPNSMNYDVSSSQSNFNLHYDHTSLGKKFPQKLKKIKSWETFPRSKKKKNRSTLNTDILSNIKKADSFEGHEEAVRTLVAAVQETRSQIRKNNQQSLYYQKSRTN